MLDAAQSIGAQGGEARRARRAARVEIANAEEPALVRALEAGMRGPLALRAEPAQVRAVDDARELAGPVERALSLARAGPATPEAVESLGEGWIAEEALAISVYCALAAPDLESALLLAVNHGGDSDSTGSITGNLLGAIHGERAIPRRWLDALELREEIERMAEELHAACGGRE